MSATQTRQSLLRRESTSTQKTSPITADHHTGMFPIDVMAWTHLPVPQRAPASSRSSAQ